MTIRHHAPSVRSRKSPGILSLSNAPKEIGPVFKEKPLVHRHASPSLGFQMGTVRPRWLRPIDQEFDGRRQLGLRTRPDRKAGAPLILVAPVKLLFVEGD